MPLLSAIRKKRDTVVKISLSLFCTVWLALAIQPCAMAFELPTSATHTSNQMDHPCPHCPEPAVVEQCQFENWGDGKQTLQQNVAQPLESSPPLAMDKLLTAMVMTCFKPVHTSCHFLFEQFVDTQTNTPTSQQDILLC